MEDNNILNLNLPTPNYDNILVGNYTSSDVELVSYESHEEKFYDEDWQQEYFIIYNSYFPSEADLDNKIAA